MLQSMVSRRVRHNLVTEQQQLATYGCETQDKGSAPLSLSVLDCEVGRQCRAQYVSARVTFPCACLGSVTAQPVSSSDPSAGWPPAPAPHPGSDTAPHPCVGFRADPPSWLILGEQGAVG